MQRSGKILIDIWPKITREMVVTIQGLIILFSGALAYMLNPYVEMLWHLLRPARPAPSGGEG